MNFVFAAKHLNGKKIDSHLHFFRGYCEMFDPDYCLMLDIGTKPLSGSIGQLIDLLDTMEDIGGACGDMGIDMSFPKNPLVYA
jgi:chitin synthase